MGLPSRVPTVEDIKTLEARGPWTTKSGGKLNVLFGVSLSVVQEQFFHYDPFEMSEVPADIRGLRFYTVSDLPKGKVGGTEWHRIREEMVFALQGSVRWICEDLLGGQSEMIIDNEVGVWIPPFILHTYEVLTQDTCLLAVASTLFLPDDPRTHDTYSLESFREMQMQVAKSK